MKIMLLNSPYRVKISKDSRWPEFTKSGTLYYPFWLSYATGVLMEFSNHKPLLVDAVAKEMDQKETLKTIEKFDPEIHEAVRHLDPGDETISYELQGGYKVEGQLLYPARVVIGPSSELSEGNEHPPNNINSDT